MNLKVGDWVRSYSAGIWQIYRILDYKCLDPKTGNERCKTTVFCKRFVSNSLKRSFKEESCDPLYVNQLIQEELDELNQFIGKNPKLYEKFLEFEPKSLACIYNARVAVPENIEPANLAEELSKSEAMRDIDINKYLTGLGYDTKSMPYFTVQFVSENYTVKNGYLAFKFSRVLGA